jgi:hypothetical protein
MCPTSRAISDPMTPEQVNYLRGIAIGAAWGFIGTFIVMQDFSGYSKNHPDELSTVEREAEFAMQRVPPLDISLHFLSDSDFKARSSTVATANGMASVGGWTETNSAPAQFIYHQGSL